MDIYLLIRYFACQVTPGEESLVRTWLLGDEDGSRARLYREAHLMYEGMVLYSDDRISKYDMEREKENRRPKGWKAFGARMLRAAVVVAVAAAAAFWGKVSVLDALSGKTEIVRVPAGDRMDMILADGTHIWMNSGTEVELPVIFSRKGRNIKLNEGEVLLDVAKDEKKPFTVDTWAGKVTVLGTRFEVTANEPEKEFSTSLLRGSVKVSNASNPEEEYVLTPNTRVRLEEGSFVMERIRDANSVGCWSQGIIEVSSVPFDELMRRFEKAFDVNIIIEREEMPVITYTRGKVRVSDGLDHALSVLRLVSRFDYEYDVEASTVIIR